MSLPIVDDRFHIQQLGTIITHDDREEQHWLFGWHNGHDGLQFASLQTLEESRKWIAKQVCPESYRIVEIKPIHTLKVVR